MAIDRRTTFPLVVAIGRRLAPHEDLYHWVLTLGWPAFFGAVAAAFFILNGIFALLFFASPGSVQNASSPADCFFFSVQTLGTIGYGVMAPQTTWAHVVVTIEALVGILFTAIVTGLTFARFARPQARILFSEKIVIAPRDGEPHLMFRMANWRRNQIVEATLHVILLVTETTKEGDVMRRPTPLALVREKNALFTLSWTAMHKIDEKSPFFGEGAIERLRGRQAEIFVALSGLDETLMQPIVARFRYGLDDIVPNARFSDVLVLREDGTRVIDYDKFHDIVPIEGKAP